MFPGIFIMASTTTTAPTMQQPSTLVGQHQHQQQPPQKHLVSDDPDKLLNEWLGELENLIGVSLFDIFMEPISIAIGPSFIYTFDEFRNRYESLRKFYLFYRRRLSMAHFTRCTLFGPWCSIWRYKFLIRIEFFRAGLLTTTNRYFVQLLSRKVYS